MKFILPEKKLILQEKKLWLIEAINRNDISNAIKLVDEAITKFNAADPTNSNKLKTALDTFKATLDRTRTTANSTSSINDVEKAFKDFWKVVEDTKILDINPDDLTASDGIATILKPYKNTIKLARQIYGTTDLVVPSATGEEINSKLLLKTVTEIVPAFDNVVSRLDNSTKTGAKNKMDKFNLEFIKKSLEIYKESLSDLKIATNRTGLEDVIKLITPEGLQKSETLTRIAFELKKLNQMVKASSDKDMQQKKEEEHTKNQNWEELYKNTVDKAVFWDKYFKGYWGANANKVAQLGSAFRIECETYGFKSKYNYFIQYLENFLLATGGPQFNSAQYQLIHNLIARDNFLHYTDLKWTEANREGLVIYQPDLFNHDLDDMEKYIWYNRAIAKHIDSNEDIMAFMLNKENKTLLPLEDIRANYTDQFGSDINDGMSLSMSTLGYNKAIKDLYKQKKDTLGAYLIILNHEYSKSKDLADKIAAKFGMRFADLSGADIEKYAEEFAKKYGKPNANDAKNIIQYMLDNWKDPSATTTATP